MKLFKRKQKEPLLEPEKKAKKIRQPADSSSLYLALLLCLLCLLAASALLGWNSLQIYRQQLQQNSAQLQANALANIDRVIKHIDNDVRAIAANPVLPELLDNKDTAAITTLEQHLRQRADVVDVYISARGKASRQSERPAPVSYAALDLIANAESDDLSATEFVKAAGQQYLYKAAAIKQQDRIIGTVLVVYDGTGISQSLPLTGHDSQLTLRQKLADTPAVQIANSGHSSSSTEKTIRTAHPSWQLVLRQPGAELPELPGLNNMLIALAVILFGSLGSLLLLNSSRNNRIAKDCNLFSQLIQDWQMGKPLKPEKIRTHALQALAASLEQTVARAPATSQQTDSPRGQPDNQFDDDILALRKDQVMEVEEHDSFAGLEEIEEAEFVDEQEVFDDVLDIDILDEQDDPFGLNEQTSPREQARLDIEQGIFRAYDIRGQYEQQLNEDTAYWIGRAVATQCRAQGQNTVIVGRDGRLSSPQLSAALIEGLNESGCQVLDLGLVPTPVVYFATHSLESDCAVMVTGSHNPPQHNGFKIVIGGQTLAEEQIQSLYQRIRDNQLDLGEAGSKQTDILPHYLERISSDIAIARPLKVVLDCGNGAAGVIAPQLFEALGCNVISLNTEVDGNFPAHHPDPGKPENLEQLIHSVAEHQADIGIAFDGDGDRLGVVTDAGSIIYPDRLMMLLAKDVVSRNPGADIVFDVKCSRRLAALISGYGGRPVMWKTGHSLMKAKLQETGALLGGEMSGHIFYSERWYGFDDGLYAAARLLEILALEQRSAEQVFAAFPSSQSTPELQLAMPDEAKFKVIAALQQRAQWGEGKVNNLDGIRVDFPKSWGLVRASNTTANLVFRFEGDSTDDLAQVMELFREQLHSLIPNLPWPFTTE